MYSRVVWCNTSASMLLVAMVSVYKCEPYGILTVKLEGMKACVLNGMNYTNWSVFTGMHLQ